MVSSAVASSAVASTSSTSVRRTDGRGQAGMTLVEVLLSIGLSTMIVVPLTMWGVFALAQEGRSHDLMQRTAASAFIDTWFAKDVAGALEVTTSAGTDCSPAPSGTTRVVLVLRSGDDPLFRTTYVEVTRTTPSGHTETVLMRRRCVDGGAMVSQNRLGSVVPGSGGASCFPATGADACRRVQLTTTAVGSSDPIVVTATRRVDTDPVTGGATGNRPPRAVIVTDRTSIPKGGTVNFSGASSTDREGPIASWDWEFPGGQTRSGASQSWSFTHAGQYPVVLTVTDAAGATNTTFVTITVINQVPVAVGAVTPTTGDLSTTFTFDASGSNDPDGHVVSYTWNFGSGSTPTTTAPVITHQFPPGTTLGLRNVELIVTDDDGDSSSTTISVTISGRPPTAAITLTSDQQPSDPGGSSPVLGVVGPGGSTLNVNLVPVANDPDVQDGRVTAWSWTVSRSGATLFTSSVEKPTMPITAALGPGTYDVSLTVTDSDHMTATATRQFRVAPPGARHAFMGWERHVGGVLDGDPRSRVLHGRHRGDRRVLSGRDRGHEPHVRGDRDQLHLSGDHDLRLGDQVPEQHQRHHRRRHERPLPLDAAMRPRRVQHIRSQGSQSGYALLIVLALITLTGVVIAALLGMSMTTARTVSALDRSAADRRAADGALTAALAQMRVNPSTSGTGDACAHGTRPPVGTILFDQGDPDPTDDVSVDVTCTPEAALDTGAVAATKAGGVIDVIGQTPYTGGVAWSTNCSPGSPGPGCFPWQLTMGVIPWMTFGSQLSTLGPTLVHSGPQPLRLAADVEVARSAAAARNPTDAPAAIQVGGQYEQGITGPFSIQGGGACGVLGRTHPWGAPGARVLDADIDPACDAAAPKVLDPDPVGPTPPFPVPSDRPTVPTCPGGQNVVTFAPGTYDSTATAALNHLLGGSCTNRTFWFQPGTYSFDIDDPAVAAADRHRLVIDDPTAKVVFGAPHGWSVTTGPATSDFPVACDPAVSGASIALTGRSAIAQRQGRVAICPAMSPTGTAYPAVVQTNSAPSDERPISVTSTDFTPAQNLVAPASDGVVATSKPFSCSAWAATCTTAAQTFTTIWRNGGTAPLSSLQLYVAGSEENGNVGTSWRHVVIAVQPAGSSTPVCSATYTGLPGGREHPIVYDLLDATAAPGCRTALSNESQLDGAKITVAISFDFSCLGVLGCPYVDTLRLTDVSLRTNAWVGSGASSSARVVGGQADWINAATVATGSGPAAEIAYDMTTSPPRGEPCSATTRGLGYCQARRGNDPANDRYYQLQLTNISTASGSTSMPGFARLATLDAVVGQQAILEGGFYDEGTTTFSLTRGATTCSATFPTFVTTSQTTAYDLYRSTDCQSRFPDAASLVGSSLTMDVRFACTPEKTLLNNPCQVWMHPKVTKVQLAATTTTYMGAPPGAVITTDDANGSSFTSTGKVITPGTDLDVHWKGAVSQTQPLIADELVVHGLGSDMTPSAQMGTLCCSASVPAVRAVRLEARIDGQLKGYVVALISDRDPGTGVVSPGRGVDVLEWELCVGGCSAPPP